MIRSLLALAALTWTAAAPAQATLGLSDRLDTLAPPAPAALSELRAHGAVSRLDNGAPHWTEWALEHGGRLGARYYGSYRADGEEATRLTPQRGVGGHVAHYDQQGFYRRAEFQLGALYRF